ncbi:uncharacterized protein RAG0_03549 [Rhynchosporium agropyri]|uniref:Lccl domain-containing protein n=3 Tax=Rhynchosporium TaxID=38037 RepID=A0A1E1MI72_RHYSE|nr:uncharacterized protein RAG0_03549 [Rhynchosporium agropyri]CZT07400.1 uncharacterized protein RCO7_07342 [Rhynchosporium commune]CZT48792.1 uncharacterized protein RSE6_09544 [Rhynchosporium secalis]
MAAPAEITLKDLSGQWVMNKTLSDDTDAVLILQGIGWWTRKAIGLATVTLHTKQYIEDGITHIDIDQTATGGVKGTTELRALNWEESSHNDHVFGNIKGRSRWSTFQEIDDSFLKEGWLEGDEEKAGPEGEKHIESLAVNEEKGWNARQIWGFAMVDGKRYYVRRVVVTKGAEVLKVRLVYDFYKK